MVVSNLYDRYFDYKIFELLRDRLQTTVNEYRKEEGFGDIYSHLFIAPQDSAGKQSFKLQGVKYPFVCMWPLSYFDWVPEKYSQSVLQRTFTYLKDGEEYGVTGYLYYLKKQVALYASSYFTDFTQQVSMDLLDFDRLRYFTISCNELLPGCQTKIEFKKASISFSQKVDEKGASREFSLAAIYDFSVAFPVINKRGFIENIEIYLNNNSIYEHRIS